MNIQPENGGIVMNISQHQLKVLILICLVTARCPLTIYTVNDIFGVCGISDINVADAIQELADLELITLHKDDDGITVIKITHNGDDVAETLKKDVSMSLRERVVAATGDAMAALCRNIGVTAETVKGSDFTEDEFTLRLALKDDDRTLMKIEMYTPTKFQAELMAQNFRDKTLEIYRTVLKALTESQM